MYHTILWHKNKYIYHFTKEDIGISSAKNNPSSKAGMITIQ